MLENDRLTQQHAGTIFTANIRISGKQHSLSAGILSFDHVRIQKLRSRENRYRWLYVLQGDGKAIDDEIGHEYELAAGALFYRAADCLHSVIRNPEKPWLEFFISVPREVFTLWCDMGALNPNARYQIPANRADVHKQIRALLQTLQMNASNNPAAVHAAFFNLFSAVNSVNNQDTRNQTPQEKLSQIIMQQLKEEPEIPLHDIAASLGITPDYLCRIVRKNFELTPVQYRIRRRLEKAKTLLRETAFPIEQIAERLGYADRFTFSRQFSRYEKTTPAAFRKQQSS